MGQMVTRMSQFKEEHEGICLGCIEGKLKRGLFPSSNSKTTDVEQPKGFEVHDQESHICWLKKTLYGLKQVPRAWYERIANYLTTI